jgi:uncharacterized membrane protein
VTPDLPDRPQRQSVGDTPGQDPTTSQPQRAELLESTEVDERLEIFEARLHRGPLPTPEMLRQYDAVLPGCARRMVEGWENQTQHRQRLERRMVDANIQNRSRGQIMAFIIAMTAIIGGIVLVATDHRVAGLATIFVPLSSIIAIFVYSQIRARRAENGTNGGGGVASPES